jgi:hypothetical protein
VGAGCLVLILAALGLFLWGIWERSASPGPAAPAAAARPTKAEWLRRAATVGQGFLLQNGKILAPRDALYRAVGEPSSTQMMGSLSYLYWDCADGTIQLSVTTGHLAVNQVSGDVSAY